MTEDKASMDILSCCWVIPRSGLGFFVLFFLEHLQHAVSHQKSTDHIDRRESDGNHTRTTSSHPSPPTEINKAPMTAIPEIALAPDIKGVAESAVPW